MARVTAVCAGLCALLWLQAALQAQASSESVPRTALDLQVSPVRPERLPAAAAGPGLPDLVLQDIVVFDTTLAPGELVAIDFTVCNSGSGPADAETLAEVLISDDTDIDSGDTVLGMANIPVLQPLACVDVSGVVRIPTTATPNQVDWIIICLDTLEVLAESVEVNNCALDAGGIQVEPCQPSCGKQNVACLPAGQRYDNRTFVGRVITPTGGLCSGWIFAAPNCIITNRHCVTTNGVIDGPLGDVTGMFIQFDVECDACAGGACRVPDSYDVVELVHDSMELDYVLLRTAGSPADIWGQAAIDPDPPQVDESVYVYHHARGGKKGIDNGKVVGGVQPNLCFTGSAIAEFRIDRIVAGGASGSPVFRDTNHCVAGMVHCGSVNCGTNNFPLPMSAVWADAQAHVPADCSVQLCGLGACCVNGQCLAGESGVSCAALSGVFLGSGSVCSADACDPGNGACCIKGACQDDFSEAECAANAGQFGGAGSSCQAVRCLPPGCGRDAECQDGDACNGSETCEVQSGVCVPGTALQCDDGVFCNGLEFCDRNGGCQAGQVPCPGEPCDEDTDTCGCANIGACDDGNVCNGFEICDVAQGICLPGSPQTCDDGLFCNGLETCDPLTGCMAGAAPCGAEPCSEMLQACGCSVDEDCDDGDLCNGLEFCDPAAALCIRGAPLGCDDGDACNGAETCDPKSGCGSGEPPTCDDGLPCTDDGCDVLAGCQSFDNCPSDQSCSPLTGLCASAGDDDDDGGTPPPPSAPAPPIVVFDSDGDGVPDPADACPGTSAGVTVDVMGCAPRQLDSDEDGVPDDQDSCPDTTDGSVDADGCAATQRDGDADGVSDADDDCPGTRLEDTTATDARGCAPAQLDDDDDGVTNDVDACPDLQGPIGADGNGCPDTDGDGVTDDIDGCPDSAGDALVDASGCPVEPEPQPEPQQRPAVPAAPDNTPVGQGAPLCGATSMLAWSILLLGRCGRPRRRRMF